MQERKEFSFKTILDLLRLHKMSLIAFVGIFMALLMAYSLIMPQTYSSTATMLPPSESGGGGGLSGFLSSMAGGGITLGDFGKSGEVKIYADIIKSRSVAEYIDSELGLRKLFDAEDINEAQFLELIRGMISVDIENSGMVLISASHTTPYFATDKEIKQAKELSANIANHAIKGLDEVLRNKNVSTARKTREYIQRELAKYETQLDSVENEMQEFQQNNKVLAIDEQTSAIVSQAIKIGNELAIARIDYNLARQEFEPGSTKLQSLRKKMEYLEEQYNQIQSGGISSDEFSIPLGELPAIARRYADLMREREILEQVILYLETQRHQEGIQEEKDVPVVEVLDEAVPNDTRDAPRRKNMAIIGFLLSSLLAITAVIGYAFWRGRIYFAKANSE
ncbi:MAG: GumC family protein [Candidatus Kapaibacterium sp.]